MNILRILIVSLIILLNFIFQNTFSKYLQIFGISPNTEIIIIISFSILKHEFGGAITGLCIGLLYDIIWEEYIGLHALLYMLVGYFCAKPFKNFYRENYIIPLLLVCFSSIFYNISYYISTFLFKGKLNIFYYIKSIVLPETFYNIVVSIPVYRIIYAINKYLEEKEKSKRKLF